MTLRIRKCPTCGSRRIRLVCRDWKSTRRTKSFVVPDLEFYECPACGECVYDRDAMRKIESHSPDFNRVKARG